MDERTNDQTKPSKESLVRVVYHLERQFFKIDGIKGMNWCYMLVVFFKFFFYTALIAVKVVHIDDGLTGDFVQVRPNFNF